MNNKIKTIICIIEDKDLDDEKCFKYWPYENIEEEIIVTSETIVDHSFFIETQLSINNFNGDKYFVKHILINKWPDHSTFDLKFITQFI